MPFAVILYVLASGTEESTSSIGLRYAVASGALASAAILGVILLFVLSKRAA
jgi:hypothetical protein